MYVVWRFVPANLSVIVHGRRIYSVAQVHHRQALSSTSVACLCHLQEHVADVEGAEHGGLEPGTMALDVASSAFDSLPGQKTANTAMALRSEGNIAPLGVECPFGGYCSMERRQGWSFRLLLLFFFFLFLLPVTFFFSRLFVSLQQSQNLRHHWPGWCSTVAKQQDKWGDNSACCDGHLLMTGWTGRRCSISFRLAAFSRRYEIDIQLVSTWTLSETRPWLTQSG